MNDLHTRWLAKKKRHDHILHTARVIGGWTKVILILLICKLAFAGITFSPTTMTQISIYLQGLAIQRQYGEFPELDYLTKYFNDFRDGEMTLNEFKAKFTAKINESAYPDRRVRALKKMVNRMNNGAQVYAGSVPE